MSKKVMEKMFDNPAPKMGIPQPKDLPRIQPARISCSHKELEKQLQKYLKLIKDLGADDARIISDQDIPQDPRVLLKCSHPKCPCYGRSGCCPPHCTGDFPKAKEYLRAYN
jgi:hypothetical protein